MSRLYLPYLLVALLFSTGGQHATAPAAPAAAPATGTGYGAVPATASSDTTYVFGWGELPLASAKPRGGTTRGTPVTLAPDRALTPRERQVLGYAELGHSNKLIAYSLGLAPSTVATVLGKARKKIGTPPHDGSEQ